MVDCFRQVETQIFGTEKELREYFGRVIIDGIAGIESTPAEAIRSLIAESDVFTAYEVWQDTYKSELDTFNWDSQEIEVQI